MRILVGLAGAVLIVLMLLEIFLVFLLPRRVKRDPQLARRIATWAWRPWRALARLLPDQAADTLLGVYGPFGLLLDLLLWVAGLMLGYGLLQWAGGSHLAARPVDFGNDIYFAAASLASSGTDGLASHSTFARAVQVLDAATGLAVLGIVIGYLPSLYQAFSRRETTVSQLDARAGSPPSAGRLVVRTTALGGWSRLNEYLHSWETWSAELMETHLSYPALAFFRSQHLGQNWLSALCTILDASALAVSAAPKDTVPGARYTFAISRHAVADLAYTFRVDPITDAPSRLPRADFDALIVELRESGIELGAEPDAIWAQLERLRRLYEPYVTALSGLLVLAMPPWLAPESPTDNWRTTGWH